MALVSTHAARAGADVAQPSSAAYFPAQLQSAYGLTAAAARPPDGETVAIVDAYNDPRANSDLNSYRAGYDLGTCNQGNSCLTIMNEYGSTSNLPKADSTGGWQLEESLDLDMVSAICPNCSIILVEANSASITDLAIAERTAVRSGAEAVSNSWGSGAEFTGERVFDQDFYAPGVAITAAGGDDGYGTQYPAVSPYVTAVGGTTLTGTMGDWTQSAWNGTGAGCSELEAKPSWQTLDASSPGGCLNRTANDVAAVADPNPGVWVYDSVADPSAGSAAGWNAVGGTSVGAPIAAAAFALADVAAGGPHAALIRGTFPAAYPYQSGSGFTDVTGGIDGVCEAARLYLCEAVPGYDGPTGMGVINGTAGLTGPPGGEVTVLSPGTEVVQAGARVTLRLNVQPSSATPAVSMSGLPGSLTADATGVIRGTAPATPGTYQVSVTAKASGLATGAAKFTIFVVPKIKDSHPAAGLARLNGGRMCLTGARGSWAPGTAVQIQPCANKAAQAWSFVPSGLAGSGLVEIHGRCLTVATGRGNGATASIQRCGTSTRQQWTYQQRGEVRNAATGRCLAVHGKPRSGHGVVVWSCGGGASIAWVLAAAPVLSAISGRCLASGTRVEVSGCNASSAQRWTTEPNMTIVIAGKCLAVAGRSMLDGAAIELAPCSKSAAEVWVRWNGELINGNSGRCLADPGDSTASGTALIQNDCYREPGEIWVVS